MIMQIVARSERRRNRIKSLCSQSGSGMLGQRSPGNALKNVDMTNLGANMFLRLPENTLGGETP
jgi:hypothetical protein